MASRLVPFIYAVGIAVATSQCGGSGSGPTGASQPAIQKAATANGDNQTGVVGTALSAPLRVVVTLDGVPQEGTTVTWAAAGTGSSVSPGASTTGTDGVATTSWTLGQAAGTQTATASLAGASGSPVSFTASATAGPGSQMSVSSGDNQAGTPNSALPDQLKVKVGDVFGNGVEGVTVEWQVTSGAASLEPTSSATDAGGVAATTATLGGESGSVAITATSVGLTGSPVTFHATVGSAPTSAAVDVGDNFFKSSHNASSNPAVDTVAVGGTVTWTWTGSNTHSVQSTGSPSFTSSAIMTSGTYAFTFTTAGTYQYDCAVHGASMTGTVVVR